MQNKEPVLELNLNEILTIFPRLKALEDKLSEPERDILSKMEGLLYEYLSIDELETLLKRI
ncbi:MAG TPA: hypothetical protein PLB48_01150 [Treponema sp.]|nr:hypothetical protein [Treponema sp.]HPC70386.1 hypothetical protein [Treponema sp.]HRS03023.1 hypothetical protein [Treponema sp.]HRU27611.1 hypothetical protein [Treponema sp.]